MRKAAALGLLFLCTAAAQEIAGLDAYVRHEMEDKHLPGLSIALVDDQRVILQRNFGDAGDGTVYRIGALDSAKPLTIGDAARQLRGLCGGLGSAPGLPAAPGVAPGSSGFAKVLPKEKVGAVTAATTDGAQGVIANIAGQALIHLVAARLNRPAPPFPITEPIPAAEARGLAGHYAGFDLIERAGELYVLRRDGGWRLRVRRRGGELIVDDRMAFGDKVAEGAKVVPKLASNPFPGLVGEYGPDAHEIYILERYGQLNALIDRYYYPLRRISGDVFQFAEGSLYYGGKKVTFTPDAVVVGTDTFQRRPTGPGKDGIYRIQPLRPVAELRREALKMRPPQEKGEFRASDLVDLTAIDPSIKLDIRYATADNFLSTPVYPKARAMMQRPAAEALARASHKLHAQGFGLLIHDAYRPWYVSRIFWDATQGDQHNFVADPSQGSRHNRGCAVDLTMFDLKTGRAVEMTGAYDEMSERSYPDYPGGTSLAREHREILRRAMEEEGFAVYETEWWHFDYRTWREYPILNQDF